MSDGAYYLAVVLVCVAAVGPLSRARRPSAVPRCGIVVWQAVLSSVAGLLWAAGLAPYGRGERAGVGRLARDVVRGRPVSVLV